MAYITSGKFLWRAVSKAFGLEGRKISRLVLDLRSGEAPRIRITEFMTDDAETEFIRILEMAEWREIDSTGTPRGGK